MDGDAGKWKAVEGKSQGAKRNCKNFQDQCERKKRIFKEGKEIPDKSICFSAHQPGKGNLFYLE